MNSSIQRWSLLAATVAALALVGCTKNPEPQAPVPTTESTAPVGEAEHGDSAEGVTPAGNVSEIWTQIEDEKAKLSTAIETGELKAVHHLAFGIRDLVIALADKAKAGSNATAAELDPLVDKVRASATKLDALGDAGNLSGTQAEFAELNTTLTTIRTVSGVH